MSLQGIRKPDPLPAGANEVDRINYNNKMQEYWFALQTEQNRQAQEATAKSNIAKAEHDALMAIANNMK